MAKMRVTQHSGRSGSARHNDRDFLAGKPPGEIFAVAPNINPDLIGAGETWSIGQEGETFREAELNYYRATYSPALEVINQKYRDQRHPERCRTIDQLYEGARTRPEEIIIQIGTKDDNISPEIFTKAVKEYIQSLEAWSAKHGNPMKILDYAIHLDEATPHCHIRRVWEYRDKDGLIRLGQNKALEAAGVPLANPYQPEGRYNNRKIKFDEAARSTWQSIAKANGLDIETQARPEKRKHLELSAYQAEMKRQERERAEQDAKKWHDIAIQEEKDALEAEEERKQAEEALKTAHSALFEVKAEQKAAQNELAEFEAVLERVRGDGGLSGRKKHKDLQDREYIRLYADEIPALEAAALIKTPLIKAQEEAERILSAAKKECAKIKNDAQKAAQQDFDRYAIENELLNTRLSKIQDLHPEWFTEKGTLIDPQKTIQNHRQKSSHKRTQPEER